MPRDGSFTLSDIRQPTLTIVCEGCGRSGRFTVAKLMAEHGDAKLTDLLQTLTDCQKALGQHPRSVQGGLWPAAAVAPGRKWRAAIAIR